MVKEKQYLVDHTGNMGGEKDKDIVEFPSCLACVLWGLLFPLIVAMIDPLKNNKDIQGMIALKITEAQRR